MQTRIDCKRHELPTMSRHRCLGRDSSKPRAAVASSRSTSNCNLLRSITRSRCSSMRTAAALARAAAASESHTHGTACTQWPPRGGKRVINCNQSTQMRTTATATAPQLQSPSMYERPARASRSLDTCGACARVHGRAARVRVSRPPAHAEAEAGADAGGRGGSTEPLCGRRPAGTSDRSRPAG